ncbi:MAG: hypothetical protein ACOVQM_19715, partial [Pirellula sp.]
GHFFASLAWGQAGILQRGGTRERDVVALTLSLVRCDALAIRCDAFAIVQDEQVLTRGPVIDETASARPRIDG